MSYSEYLLFSLTEIPLPLMLKIGQLGLFEKGFSKHVHQKKLMARKASRTVLKDAAKCSMQEVFSNF